MHLARCWISLECEFLKCRMNGWLVGGWRNGALFLSERETVWKEGWSGKRGLKG